MEPRKQFTFYKSFLDAIESQPSARAQLALYRAVCRYAIYGEAPQFHGREEGIFFTIQPNLDAARRKAEGGMKGKKNKMPVRSGEDAGKEKESEIESETEFKTELKTENDSKGAAVPDEFSVLELYDTHCGKRLYPCEVMTQDRKREILSYFRAGYTLGDFEKIFKKAGASSFLAGQNEKGWKAGIDWILEEKNFARILEGAFDDCAIPKGASGSLGQAELEAIQRVLREG